MSMLIPKNIFADVPRRALKFLPLACAALFLPQAHSAVIDLSKPVSESITVTGINWKGDTITTGTTPDSSANGYNGTLQIGTDTVLPSLVTGVNLPGTSGYSNAIHLTYDKVTPVAADDNSRIYTNPSNTNNKLNLAGVDFTGGAWLSFSSFQAGAQSVMIMDKGSQGSSAATNGGGWSFFLDKNASGLWRIGFTARDNSASTTVYSGAYSNLGVSLDEWIHLGFSFDDTGNASNEITFYLNGSVVSTVSIARDITAASSTAGRRFSVGERSSGPSVSKFDGAIDDIFVTEGLHTFTAIPEPNSVALIAIAGAGWVAFQKARRNKDASR